MKLDGFLEVEKEYGLVEDEIEGFAYWTYFRCDLKWDLERLVDHCEEMYVHPKFSFVKKTKARLGMLRYAICNSRIPKGEHDVLILNHERKVWREDHYECIYTDQIASQYSESVVLERPYFQQHSRPVQTQNLVYTDYIELKAMTNFYFHNFILKRKSADVRKRIRERIEEPLKKICEVYQVDYNIDNILDKMVCGYYLYHVKKSEFERIIKKVKPKVIIEVVGYHFDCMLINELGREYQIPTIELQHGATGDEHIPYNYAKNTQVKQFAQYFFAFSQFWIDAARYPLPKDHLVEVGFPYLDEKAEEIKRRISKTKPAIIVFISQPMIGERLADIAIGLNQLLDREEYRIVFKLHPGEYERWRERYSKLAKTDIEVVDNNRINLYELFAEAEYQIGAYGSTATFEGLEFDLRTYILREGASSMLKLLCEKKLSVFFDSAEELYQLISTDGNNENKYVKFWKKDALGNMKREINAIIERQQ